jgi:hypothetical protein
MVTAKVLATALLLGLLFAGLGGAFAVFNERVLGASGPLVILGVGLSGAILGAITGAAQTLVDAIERKK